jgi:hypothetical protein
VFLVPHLEPCFYRFSTDVLLSNKEGAYSLREPS